MVSIVFAGVGGQGVLTVAKIVGRAAVYEGKNALMTELHGMAQRGGKISADLRIGNYKSAIIPARTAEIMVGFEELETVRNLNKIRDGALILLNKRRIHPVALTMRLQNYPVQVIENELSKHNVISIEADKIAIKLGNKRVASMVMVGALYATGILGVAEKSIEAALRESLNESVWDINLKAFAEGKKLPILEPTKVA